jgi:aspartate-semialdehyde dehydrogenase
LSLCEGENVEPRLAVVGATGLVGGVIRQVLEERKFPYRSVKFLASSKSPGRTIEFAGRRHPVLELSADSFRDVDIVLSSTPGSVSKEFSPIAAKAGAVVVDNSSAWRLDPQTPLVVPEVNADAIARHRGIIANPNCAAIQLVVALKPLHDAAKIKRVVVSTYQSSSGKGASALAELDAQIAAIGRGEAVPAAKVHRYQLAGNCIPNDWAPGEDGYTEEETKIMKETRKIMGDDSIRISATCVRVPVRIGHGESVNLEFANPISPDEARSILRKAPGVIVLEGDDGVPLQQLAAGRDETFVGRIRRDPTVEHGLNLWVVADNLRKGAATNAVQIAERLLPMLGR